MELGEKKAHPTVALELCPDTSSITSATNTATIAPDITRASAHSKDKAGTTQHFHTFAYLLMFVSWEGHPAQPHSNQQ